MRKIERPYSSFANKEGQLWLSNQAFLSHVQQRFSLDKVYYPGCGSDTNLELPGNKWKVFYLDSEIYSEDLPRGKAVEGDMGRAPFRDATFDAAFIQDIHAYPQEFSDILRTVRPKGIVIYSTEDCGHYGRGEVVLDDLMSDRRVAPVKLDYSNENYFVFSKNEVKEEPRGRSIFDIRKFLRRNSSPQR